MRTYIRMSTRGHVGRCRLPRRDDATRIVVTVLNWKFALFALAIDGVRGSTNADKYYSFDDYIELDYEEEERIHELIVDHWYNLVRYLVGLSLCIFGLIGLYFHQYASYYFLMRYTLPRETERRIGRVVLCEPLLSSTSINGENRKKKKQRKKKVKVITVRTSVGDVGDDDSTNTTSYVLEDDLESIRKLEQLHKDETSKGEPEQEATEYRMLVIYKVSKSRTSSILCCNPSEKNMVITCTNSFSVNSCASGISDIYEDTEEVINSYRIRSLPIDFDANDFDAFTDFQALNGKMNSSMDYMTMNGECEYFKWFETTTPKEVDSEVDLIMLKGVPTSACTQSLLASHLEQVGKAHMGEEDGCCKSISIMGMGLVFAIVILSLVCVFEIRAMPNPDVQQPLAYTVFGTSFGGSIVSAYLFAKLLFEQYKQKVFLSAFTVPTNTANSMIRGRSVSSILTFPSSPGGSMKRKQSGASKVSIDIGINVSPSGSLR